MFRKRYRKQIPELNTTSTADISFMLLIFFLVTSSMDTDKGLMRQMAPPPQENEQPMDVNKSLVMRVALDAKDQLTCDDKAVTLDELGEDANTSYEAYFKMQNTIVGAYQALREQYAQQHYGKHYQRCTSEERQTINDYYPLRISENMEEGGRP